MIFYQLWGLPESVKWPIVLHKSSNIIWYWGDVRPICRFIVRDTMLLAWSGELPTKMPNLDLGFHLDTPMTPSWSLVSRLGRICHVLPLLTVSFLNDWISSWAIRVQFQLIYKIGPLSSRPKAKCQMPCFITSSQRYLACINCVQPLNLDNLVILLNKIYSFKIIIYFIFLYNIN